MPPQGQTQGLSYKDQDQDQDLNFVLKDSLRTRSRTRTTTLVFTVLTEATVTLLYALLLKVDSVLYIEGGSKGHVDITVI